MPTEISLPDILAQNQMLEDQFVSIIQGQELAREIASQVLPAAQAAMKQRYDTTAHVPPFKEWSTVFLRTPKPLAVGLKTKLAPVYAGPYIIIQLPMLVTVRLRRLFDGKTLPGKFHISRLKRAEVR